MSATIVPLPGQTVSNAIHISNPWIPQIRDISHALKGENEPFPWAIEGLIVKGSANVVSGLPHSMKSFNLLAGCMELAHTQTLWGKFKAPDIKNTLYIETEDGEQLLETRIRGLLRGFGIQGREQLPNFRYARLGPFDLVEMQDKLMEVIKEVMPDFIVLSTLQGLLGGRNWNQQNEMADVNALLVRIGAMLSGGLVVITHSPQNTEVTRPAGTVAQLANYTTAIHFTKAGSSGSTYVDVKVDSKIGSEETRFRLDVILGDSPDGNGKEVRQIKYVPKKGPTKKQIIEKVIAEHGPDKKTSDIVAIVKSELEPGGKVTPKYVNTIKKKLQGKELQKEESEQQGYSSTPLVPSVSREQMQEQI